VSDPQVVRFPDIPIPPNLDEQEQHDVMLDAAKRRGGLRPGEDLTALPAGTPPLGGDWKPAGTIKAPGSGKAYDVYTRDPAPATTEPSDASPDTSPSDAPPGTDALKDVDNNFSPDSPEDTVAKCAEGFAEGFVEGFVVGYAVGFALAALGPVGAVIGVGLLLYSVYQVVTNWDKIMAAPPEEKARMIGGLAGGIVGGGLGARAGGETATDLPPRSLEPAEEFFKDTHYTDKVQQQMNGDDYHSFPEEVTNHADKGTVRTIKGGDGVEREMLEIPGEYKGKTGKFEFIKEPDGSINHRYFRPDQP
jgi:uncharacterized membrane protein (Fun14 family)